MQVLVHHNIIQSHITYDVIRHVKVVKRRGVLDCRPQVIIILLYLN